MHSAESTALNLHAGITIHSVKTLAPELGRSGAETVLSTVSTAMIFVIAAIVVIVCLRGEPCFPLL